MKEITCEIKERINLENKDFFVVKDLLNDDEHLIPVNQMNDIVDVKIGDSLNFIKESNSKQDKTFLSVVNPNYKIGSSYIFDVVGIKKEAKRSYFILKYKDGLDLTVSVLPNQEKLKKVNCIIMGYRKGIPVLRNVDLTNSEWEINSNRKFKVLGFGTVKGRKDNIINTVIIEVAKNTSLHVRAYKWHTEKIWHFKDLSCKIIGVLKDGLPKVIIDDERHPIYELGKVYEFKILGFSKRTTVISQELITVVDLIDDFETTYEVFAYPNQEEKCKKGDCITCKIEKVSTQLHLRQINNDPFFVTFEEIVKDKRKKYDYFDKYLDNSNAFYLKSQYDSRSAFWVFTYCNNIIPKIKSDLARRKEYEKLTQVINIHTAIEEWILSKGILRAIRNNDERKTTKKKVESILENNKSEKKVVESIIKFEITKFLNLQIESLILRDLYYLIRYYDLESVDEILFLKIIDNVKCKKKQNLTSLDLHYLKLILKALHKSKMKYKLDTSQDYFILSNSYKESNDFLISKYFRLTYIITEIYDILEDYKNRNLLIAQLFSFFSAFENNFENRKKLLHNAFYILSNNNLHFSFPVLINDENVELDISRLQVNPNQNNFVIESKQDFNLIKIKARDYQGFKVNMGDIEGFLPFNNITDPSLKHNKIDYHDWETNVEITIYSHQFNFFIAKQLPTDSEFYVSKRTKTIEMPKVGTILYGTVKDTQRYGVFFTTDYGDGLLRITNISDYFVHRENIPIYFKKGDKLPLYLLDNQQGKFELSFKHLIGTDFEDVYYETMEFYEYELDDSHVSEELDVEILFEIEKGFVFEQYAIIQNVISEKIKYLRFAKAFFSSTKNARSYLLNIYIEYFNSLLKLDELISDYTFERYDVFKQYIIQIKDKIMPKTLENYPESRNLLFFVEILNLFNSREEADLEKLFSIIVKPLDDNEALLKVISKTVLSNNLIISESEYYDHQELDAYTLKNLKRIRKYISQGILALEDAIEDRLAIELEEKRVYWKKNIELDEGSKLEFKSTFLTPVPDIEKKKIIDSLERELAKASNQENINSIHKRIDEIKGLTAQKRIIHSALKTISAFANTNGGTLLIGVSDDKKIFGLEQDYKSFKKENHRDEFGKRFDEIIKEYFGNSFSSTLLEKEFLKFPEGDILIINVKQSEEEIFLLKDESGKRDESLYVRNLSSSEKLTGIELAKFIKKKYRENFINNINVIE